MRDPSFLGARSPPRTALARISRASCSALWPCRRARRCRAAFTSSSSRLIKICATTPMIARYHLLAVRWRPLRDTAAPTRTRWPISAADGQRGCERRTQAAMRRQAAAATAESLTGAALLPQLLVSPAPDPRRRRSGRSRSGAPDHRAAAPQQPGDDAGDRRFRRIRQRVLAAPALPSQAPPLSPDRRSICAASAGLPAGDGRPRHAPRLELYSGA